MSDTGKTGFTLRKNLIKALQSYFLCSIALCSTSAFAAIVTIDVTGKAAIPFIGSSSGDTVDFTGSFQVDTTVPDSNASSSQGVYQNAVVASQLTLTDSDGYTFSAASSATDASEVILNPDADGRFLFESDPGAENTEPDFILQTELTANYKNTSVYINFIWGYTILPLFLQQVYLEFTPDQFNDIATDSLEELTNPTLFNSLNESYKAVLNPNIGNPFANVLMEFTHPELGIIAYSRLSITSGLESNDEAASVICSNISTTGYISCSSGGISFATNSVSEVPLPHSFAFMLTALGLLFYKKQRLE